MRRLALRIALLVAGLLVVYVAGVLGAGCMESA